MWNRKLYLVTVVERSMIRRIQALILLFAVSVIPLSICKATTVFLDFTTNDIIGENIIGQAPDIGSGTLEGLSGGTLQVTANYSINTVGAARLVFGAFTSALEPGQQLTLSYNILDFGPAFPNSGGFAGVSLYTGYSSYSNNVVGNEEEFVGEPDNGNQWGLDGTTTGRQGTGGNTNTPASATFTYVYDTGAWTFTTSGGVNISGIGVADLARDVVGKACVGRAAHEAQGIVDAGFAQQVQVGRLLELDRQRLLQGSIENGIAGCVDEVGEHHRVFFGQRAGSPGTEE